MLPGIRRQRRKKVICEMDLIKIPFLYINFDVYIHNTLSVSGLKLCLAFAQNILESIGKKGNSETWLLRQSNVLHSLQWAAWSKISSI